MRAKIISRTLREFHVAFAAMLPTPRSVAMCLILLWGVADWLQAQTVPAPTSVAGNFKTLYGTEYKDATVSRVELDGLVLTTKSGISKVYFVELPKDVQERFHYDAGKAAQFTEATQTAISQSNAAIAAQQQQRQLEAQQKQDAKITAQKQAREQQQKKRRTTSGGGYSWESYTRYDPVSGVYKSVQQSGNARMGGRHTESRGPYGSNSEDEEWGPAPKRNNAKKRETPSP